MRRFPSFVLLSVLIALLCAPMALAQEDGSTGGGTEDAADSGGGGDTTYEAPDTINVDMSDDEGANEDAGLQESVGAPGMGAWTILLVIVVAVLLIGLLAAVLAGRRDRPRY